MIQWFLGASLSTLLFVVLLSIDSEKHAIIWETSNGGGLLAFRALIKAQHVT